MHWLWIDREDALMMARGLFLNLGPQFYALNGVQAVAYL